MRRNLVVSVALLALALTPLGPGRLGAESDYPSRPIEFIIPFPPGGPADTAARIVQPKLSAALGVPILRVNKPGGGGALGADSLAEARPDGHTVFAATKP